MAVIAELNVMQLDLSDNKLTARDIELLLGCKCPCSASLVLENSLLGHCVVLQLLCGQWFA